MLTIEENELLVRTGPAAPMGQLLRRFWLPVMLAEELPEPDCPPVRLRILCEDLVTFRDSDGRIGLLDAFCAHRRANLFWGRNEECGLRCVYHGWKYDVEGNCIDVPNEPPESRFKEKIKLTAYPAQERGGVIWAYMGPPDLTPEMPALEWTRLPASHRYVTKRTQESNFLQNLEGEVDSSHVSFLHSKRGVDNFANPLSLVAGQDAPTQVQDRSPRFTVKETDYGMMIAARRNAGEDSYYWRITQFLMPSYTMIPSEPDLPISFTAAVPSDDEHMVGFTVTWRPDRPLSAEDIGQIESWTGIHTEVDPVTYRPLRNKANNYRIDREMQRNENYSGIRGIREQDLPIQEDQAGPLADRSKEHLGTADLGVIAVRRRLLKAVQDVQAGTEPAEAHDGGLYKVRSTAVVLKREAEWSEAAGDLLVAKTWLAPPRRL